MKRRLPGSSRKRHITACIIINRIKKESVSCRKRKRKELRGTVTQEKQRTAVQKLSFVGSSSDCVTRRKEDDRSKDGEEVMSDALTEERRVSDILMPPERRESPTGRAVAEHCSRHSNCQEVVDRGQSRRCKAKETGDDKQRSVVRRSRSSITGPGSAGPILAGQLLGAGLWLGGPGERQARPWR